VSSGYSWLQRYANLSCQFCLSEDYCASLTSATSDQTGNGAVLCVHGHQPVSAQTPGSTWHSSMKYVHTGDLCDVHAEPSGYNRDSSGSLRGNHESRFENDSDYGSSSSARPVVCPVSRARQCSVAGLFSAVLSCGHFTEHHICW
jgi:hypothetical protein